MSSLFESGVRGWLRVSSRLRPWLPLVLITLLAATLRLLHLGSWSIWVDEAHTWRDATVPLGAFWESERASYPISFLLVRALGSVGGFGPEWMRLPFAVIGIATVPVLGHFTARFLGVRVALLAALFLAINPWHIYWSQNARAYVLVLLFIILASASCYQAVQQRSWRLMGMSLSLGVLAVLSHPSAYLMLAVLGAYVGISIVSMRPRLPTLPRWGVGVVVVSGMALLYLLFASMVDLQTFARSKPNASLGHLLKTSAFYFRPMLLLAAAAAAMLIVKGRDRSGMFVVMWGVAPPLLLLLLPILGVQVTARYAFVSLPAVLMLAGWLCIRAADTLRPLGSRAVCYLVPLLLIVDSGTYDFFYFTSQYGDRPRWGEAADFIRSQAEDDFTILTTNEPTLNYYFRPGIHSGEDPGLPGEYSILEWEVERAGGGERYMGRKISRARGKTMFVVVTEPELAEKDVDGGIRRYLREHFHQVARFPMWIGPKDQTVLVYR